MLTGSISHNVLHDMTNITNMMTAGIGYCIYQSLHGQGCIKIHAQVLHRICCMDHFLFNLKLDFVTWPVLNWCFSLKIISSVFSWFNTGIFALIQEQISIKQAKLPVCLKHRGMFHLALHQHKLGYYAHNWWCKLCDWHMVPTGLDCKQYLYGWRTNCCFRHLPSDVFVCAVTHWIPSLR